MKRKEIKNHQFHAIHINRYFSFRVETVSFYPKKITEKAIPFIAENATASAFNSALKNGLNLTYLENNKIIEINPQGEKREVKTIDTQRTIRPGVKFKLK